MLAAKASSCSLVNAGPVYPVNLSFLACVILCSIIDSASITKGFFPDLPIWAILFKYSVVKFKLACFPTVAKNV